MLLEPLKYSDEVLVLVNSGFSGAPAWDKDVFGNTDDLETIQNHMDWRKRRSSYTNSYYYTVQLCKCNKQVFLLNSKVGNWPVFYWFITVKQQPSTGPMTDRIS